VVSFLICNGASTHTATFEGGRASKADKKGEPLLNVVSRFGHVDVARLLILNGVEVPQATIKGEDPILHTACRYGECRNCPPTPGKWSGSTSTVV
jgi:hypothetical protein